MKQIKLLGRDKLLSRQIKPRLKEGKGFVLTGTDGSGKTVERISELRQLK